MTWDYYDIQKEEDKIEDSVEHMVEEIHEMLEDIKLNVDKDTPKITLNRIIRELNSLIMLEP